MKTIFFQFDNVVHYSPVLVIMAAELMRLISLLSVFRFRIGSLLGCMTQLTSDAHFWLLTFIPCFLCSIGTLAQFVCLTLTDPPTYLILFHMRFFFYTTIDELVLSRPVSLKQWASLGILALSIGAKLIHFNHQLQPRFHTSSLAVPAIVLVQVMVEAIAHCFVVLKLKTPKPEQRLAQRIVYAMNTLIILSLVFTFNANSSVDYFTPLGQLPVMLLAVHMAAMGVCDDLIEKGQQVANFCSAIQLIASSILSFLVFNLDIDTQTTISICLVWLFLLFYST